MFDKDYFIQHQELLLKLANSRLGRHIFHVDGDKSSVKNNKIIAILPNSIFWETDNKITIEIRGHDKFGKRLFYSFHPILRLFHEWDKLWYPNFNLGFDSFGPEYPKAGANSPCDGYVARDAAGSQSLSTIVNGAGDDSDVTAANAGFVQLGSGTTTNEFTYLIRFVASFTTSAFTSSANISAITYSVYGSAISNNLGTPDFHVAGATPASTATLAHSDYGQCGSTSFGSLANASWSSAGYNDVALNATGIAAINKTGITSFCNRLSWDILTNFTGTWSIGANSNFTFYSADQGGTANDPKLVGTYTLPSGNTNLLEFF